MCRLMMTRVVGALKLVGSPYDKTLLRLSKSIDARIGRLCAHLNHGDILVQGWILTLVAGALQEKQIVVLSSNLGILSASVLSIIPLIRPFRWQSMLMPGAIISSLIPYHSKLAGERAVYECTDVQVNVLHNFEMCMNVPGLQNAPSVDQAHLPPICCHDELISRLKKTCTDPEPTASSKYYLPGKLKQKHLTKLILGCTRNY
ncbi:hypothetical protein NC652_039597 [Populus alba x Populus x berolinensis]|nr:hypothetical protein NC652_039597 [Populus alba x Populus x berolinensis]